MSLRLGTPRPFFPPRASSPPFILLILPFFLFLQFLSVSFRLLETESCLRLASAELAVRLRAEIIRTVLRKSGRNLLASTTVFFRTVSVEVFVHLYETAKHWAFLMNIEALFIHS